VREVEVKFWADAAGLKQVLGPPAFAAVANVLSEMLRSIYFDTAAGDLRKESIALRIRKRRRSGHESDLYDLSGRSLAVTARIRRYVGNLSTLQHKREMASLMTGKITDVYHVTTALT
jgi:adenylate cyclase class IV